MAPVTLTFNTVLTCDDCPWPVHVTITHPAEVLDDGTITATVDETQLRTAMRVHMLQHDT